MEFARWVFRIAGILGLLGLVPMYFTEKQVGIDTPPPITHPEFFYGFVGVAIAWQVAFIFIGQDPRRYRPLMLPSMIEKFSFASAVWILFFQGRLAAPMLVPGTFDLVLGILFVASFLRTSPARGA
jgi:hypothetical protein